MKLLLDLAESGIIPDTLVRLGIRALNRQRLLKEARRERAGQGELLQHFLDNIRSSPIAVETRAANEQHYEVPPTFFQKVLGRRLKYSCCLWPPGVKTLDGAEEAMLALTATRAELADGMDILDLGCGWGSFTLWAAARFPNSKVLAVSNSQPQGNFILDRAATQGLDQVEVATADMNEFVPRRSFDRIVSVEMFEHLRNWPEALRRVAGWLEPDGRVFLHVFAHRRFAYRFEADGDGDWMARHFFSGGIMPVHDLAARIGGPLQVEAQWLVPGTHYARTAEAWLERLDAAWPRAVAALAAGRTREEAERHAHRWRLFFLACAELFGFASGEEWVVSHARLRRAGGAP